MIPWLTVLFQPHARQLIRSQHYTGAMEHRSWVHEHGLSLVIGGVLLTWLLLYLRADPATHLGAFYGNAIADWLGSFITVVATKFWFEKGSTESRQPPPTRGRGSHFLHEHSLSVVLVVTWVGWIWWFAAIDANGKTGQVVGNIVSEWGQVLSLVWFTKYLVERGSKESRREGHSRVAGSPAGPPPPTLG